MTGYENSLGDRHLTISRELFDLVAKVIETENNAAVFFVLDGLPLGMALQIERLATEKQAIAEEKLRIALGKIPRYTTKTASAPFHHVKNIPPRPRKF